MKDPLLIASIATAISGGTAILIAATGELLVEKVGVYNVGVEGVMLVGALAGFLGADATHSWVGGLAVGGLAGAVVAAIFGIATVVFRADMMVAGVALVLLAVGATTQAGEGHVRQPAASAVPDWQIPLLSDIPYAGPALFKGSVMSYVAFLLPFGVWYLISRTRHGLNISAIGENPHAADAAGVAVIGWRLTYVLIGGVFAGVAGGVLALDTVGTWESNITSGLGWIAFAIVFFAGWRPLWIIVGAYLFGALGALGNIGQAEGWNLPSQLFDALPYLGTVGMMIARAAINRRRGRTEPWPAALGLPFYRA